jgi:hypothetical protein
VDIGEDSTHQFISETIDKGTSISFLEGESLDQQGTLVLRPVHTIGWIFSSSVELFLGCLIVREFQCFKFHRIGRRKQRSGVSFQISGLTTDIGQDMVSVEEERIGRKLYHDRIGVSIDATSPKNHGSMTHSLVHPLSNDTDTRSKSSAWDPKCFGSTCSIECILENLATQLLSIQTLSEKGVCGSFHFFSHSSSVLHDIIDDTISDGRRRDSIILRNEDTTSMIIQWYINLGSSDIM